ncbi:MAG: flagellar biosynthesis protein FliQ [Nitrospirae bacterium]|nr:flagellar biosynthesis protein FliQ [Nitrospirota bacterium]
MEYSNRFIGKEFPLTIDVIRDISAEVFKTILLVSGPVLIVSLVVGLVVSFLQAITQIQEFTLTFVPKIIAVFLTLFIAMPWIARIMIAFTTNLIENIPKYVH